MNPDNPNFRTPEEEVRAAELVKLRAEVELLRYELNQLDGERKSAWEIVDVHEATIARQAKVIEKLRAALEFIRFDFGGYSEQEMDTGSGYVWEHISGRAKTKARQTLKELEAIEQGEGM